MAYEKNTWQSGDVVTSAKLNNIENGIASGGVVICTLDENNHLDKTYAELKTAALAVYHSYSDDEEYTENMREVLYNFQYDKTADSYYVNGTDNTFTCDSEDDYPSLS